MNFSTIIKNYNLRKNLSDFIFNNNNKNIINILLFLLFL